MKVNTAFQEWSLKMYEQGIGVGQGLQPPEAKDAFEAGQAAGPNYTATNRRPVLVIEALGSKELGRCYYAYQYKVTSLFKMTSDTWQALLKSGLLANGQEFNILKAEECADYWAFEGINQCTRQPYPVNAHPYYIYHVETRVDSSD